VGEKLTKKGRLLCDLELSKSVQKKGGLVCVVLCEAKVRKPKGLGGDYWGGLGEEMLMIYQKGKRQVSNVSFTQGGSPEIRAERKPNGKKLTRPGERGGTANAGTKDH